MDKTDPLGEAEDAAEDGVTTRNGSNESLKDHTPRLADAPCGNIG